MANDSPIQQFAGTSWDVVVIGAGPAGCVAAGILARGGRRVLLAEKSHWPREKVCGGCVNHSAMATIREAGMGRALVGGQRVDRVVWRCGAREMAVPTPIGLAMPRSELDARLAAEAVGRGCAFLDGVSATVLPGRGDESARSILLRRGSQSETVMAEVVLACDGIGGTSVAGEPWARWRVARGGWIGVAATIEDGAAAPETRLQRCPPSPEHQGRGIPAGAICMHVGAGGYVGMVRLADGRIHLAAALDPRRCKSAGGAGKLIEAIVASAGMGPVMELAKRRGTGVMTRRRLRLGGHRVLAVGDAVGYVEPFTGEGMAWAVASAALAAGMLPEAGEEWPAELPGQWESAHAAMIGRQQRWCRAGRAVVHHPMLAAGVIGVGSVLPWIGRAVASRVCGREGGEEFA